MTFTEYRDSITVDKSESGNITANTSHSNLANVKENAINTQNRIYSAPIHVRNNSKHGKFFYAFCLLRKNPSVRSLCFLLCVYLKTNSISFLYMEIIVKKSLIGEGGSFINVIDILSVCMFC